MTALNMYAAETAGGYGMKKRRIGFQIIISMCAMLGWWGFLYPELVLTPDTLDIKAVDENGGLSALPDDWEPDGSLYLDIVSAGRDKITFRSRLLTNLTLFWEAFHGREADK